MSGAARPPSEGGAPSDDDVPRPPSPYEHMLVREADDVAVRCAHQLARKFPRLVCKRGLISIDDLVALGQEALYRAARVFDEDQNPEFRAFACYYVRGAMLDAIDDLLFEERVKRAVGRAENKYCAYHAGDDYNVMKHDENEARRRYRAFANGVLAATLTAALAEARSALDEAELIERREYERAILALDAALARLSDVDQQMLALMYRDLMNLKEASVSLGLPYGTARARHARALKLLHDSLAEQGIARLPHPVVVPELAILEARAPPAENDASVVDQQRERHEEPR